MLARAAVHLLDLCRGLKGVMDWENCSGPCGYFEILLMLVLALLQIDIIWSLLF